MIEKVTETETDVTTRGTEWPSSAELESRDGAPEAPPAATAEAVVDTLPEDRYLNRELSWLDFNARVLALAADTSLPLLERAKFLAIFASNLDEFYMVRVAGLKRQEAAEILGKSVDGLTPTEQLGQIAEEVRVLVQRHARQFVDVMMPALANAGIVVSHWSDLSAGQRTEL